jgi:parvulin-like peptidyl-prolyl isomerase
VREEARAQGAPSDAEVDAIVTERWYELDRPRLARTTHAVVMTKADAVLAKARRVADAIVAAVRGVSDKAEFTKRARAVPAQDVQVRVEDLDPVAEDGRVMPSRPPAPGAPPMTFDLAFARGALALEKAGDQSPIVQSSFGLHVILLTETLEPIHYSRQQLNELVRQEVLDRRAKKLEDALLERLARSTAVSRERSASDLMMRVKVREP